MDDSRVKLQSWIGISRPLCPSSTAESASSAIAGFPMQTYSSRRRPYDLGKSGKKNDYEKSEEFCDSEAWVSFTETTSLHGLRYIWLKETFTVRRLLWLILVLVCVGLMSYQITDRIIYYYNWPVTVNVRVNYNTSLAFPTVTVCNQNAFRATAAARNGHYQLLSDMFNDVITFRSHDLHQYNASQLTMESILERTAHRKEDLIVNCRWSGETCGPDDFTEVLTDHGLCYMFNGIDNITARRFYSHYPGSENGLSLTLNVEQYEYMPGPHDAAGVKVLIHDGKQFPKVGELGIAFPTGSHSFVGIKLISVNNLPSPYGKCRSPTLKYFKHYSLENCEVECLNNLLCRRCGCCHYYMATQQQPGCPVCSLDQFYSCYKNNTDDIRNEVKDVCDCAIPCHFVIYDLTVSHATTSNLIVDRFLAQTDRAALRQKYEKARDVIGRLQKDKVNELKTLKNAVETRFTKLDQLITEEISSKLNVQSEAMNKVSNETVVMFSTVYRLFQYQRYIVMKNFVRARDAMDERTFSVLAQGVQELTFRIEEKIKLLTNRNLNPSVREAIYLLVQIDINSRIDIAERALKNYTELYDAYMKGQCIFDYKYLDFKRSLSKYIVPKILLLQAFNRTKSIQYRAERLGKDIQNISRFLGEYKQLALTAFETGSYDSEKVHYVNSQFLVSSREYLQSRSMFFKDVINWPVQKMKEREDDFLKMKRRFEQLKQNFLSCIENLKTLLAKTKSSLLNEVGRGLVLIDDYLNEGSVSKLAVAEHFNSEIVDEGLHSLEVFFHRVRSRGREMSDEWGRIRNVVLEMWELVLKDRNMKPYLEHVNVTYLLQNYRDVELNVSGEIAKFKDELELGFWVQNVDSDFLRVFEYLRGYMINFIESSHVDAKFVKNNFLRLDIFYRELNYEEITQQKAYDVFGLLCDIGGSMGLFIGASVMTIFEIIDLVAYRTSVKILRQQNT